MRDENKADRVQIVSGRGESETWKEVNASGLAQPFKTFRSVFAEELTTRFLLDTTPNKHIQLALKMNPAINTEPKGPLLSGKSAMHEMMTAEYKRALRRAALRRAGSSAPAPVPVPAAADEAEAEDAPWDAPAAAPAVAPAVAPQSAKRRKGLLGVVAAQQSTEVVEDGASRIDQDVQTEVERFNLISRDIITAGAEHKYYFSSERFNLRAFWADHKETLPLHYSVYVAEVGCKKAAAANVESVFSGAGKFTEEGRRRRALGTSFSRAWCGCTTTGSTPSSARRSRRWSSATWRSSTRRRLPVPVRRLRRSLRLERQARLPTRPPPRPRPQPPRKPEL